ncbi:HAD family phosphatase [Brevundimonas sp.]|uniref:HAD family hydrolase n=1 Tax=Brevundimonas sp. TaxID=1871086 RepID=UPI0028A136C8|nr:HAD family phosphatase [Brevundimonas sp.]
MIKAILFDMDGVLIDAKDWHYEALNDALALFGMEISRDAHLSTYDGLPTRTKLEMLTETRGLPRRLHSVINQVKQKRTAEIAIQRCKPTFNHAFALSRLRDDGMKMAVCSNSIRKTIELMMELSDLSQNLDLIVSNEDVSKAKPDPEMYLKAMSELGVQPHETLILEDNEHGIQAARASGAHVLVIGTPDDVEYARIKQAMAEAVS